MKAQLVKQVENLLLKQAVAPGLAQTLGEVFERTEAAREIFLEQRAGDHQLKEEMGHLQEEVEDFGGIVVVRVEVLPQRCLRAFAS